MSKMKKSKPAYKETSKSKVKGQTGKQGKDKAAKATATKHSKKNTNK
jgi:hypothetical protein